jgi:hypothetical protein
VEEKVFRGQPDRVRSRAWVKERVRVKVAERARASEVVLGKRTNRLSRIWGSENERMKRRRTTDGIYG